MEIVSNAYKTLLNTSLSLTPQFKIVVNGTEYLGNVIMAYPKISQQNTSFIGGFPSKICSFDLYNPNNDIDLENKEVIVYKGLVVNNAIEWVKQGIFIPQAKDIKNDITAKTYIVSNASDKRQLLDVQYISNLDWTSNHTGLEIVNDALSGTGISLETTNFSWASYSFNQPNFPSNVTKTEVINRIAEIGGEIASISRNGGVVIKGQIATGDTISRTRYTKLTKEKPITINTVVLGKDGADDDIIYPTTITGDRVEFKINDNPYVDLNRESMISLVANYVIGKSYTPFELTDFKDGFIYDINDVLTVQDKNGDNLSAVVLNYDNTARISSTIKAETSDTNNTNYKIAGSVKETVANVQFQVDHINNQITSLVSEVSDVTGEITDLQNSIDYFSVDLSQYNITVPTTSDKKPLATKNYDVNFYGYYKGDQVVPNVSIGGSNTGITATKTSSYLRFAVNVSTAITNTENEYTITFTYTADGNTYTVTKNVDIVQALQGADGTGVNILGSYNSLAELEAAHPTGDVGDAYLINGDLYVWNDENSSWDDVGSIQGPPGTPGTPGTSTYFYVRYSANANGNPMTTTPQSNTKYMGVASTTSSTAPSSYSAYVWSEIKGEDGQNGTPGTPGADGESSYLHIKYSDNGTTFTSNGGETPGRYRGELVDTNIADSTNFDDYTWYDMALMVEDELNDIRQEIITNTTNITQNQEHILMEALQDYVATGDFETYKNTISTQFIQTANDFNFNFNNLSSQITTLDGITHEQFSEISKYIRFIDGNILLGETGNEITLKIENDRISFLQNNNEVAYLSNNKLVITDGEFLNSLIIGNFAWKPRTNGNLSLVKIGGGD